eukprot:scaffold108372_cov20-Prasinocladus_malaysianus.AAC.1
MQFPPTKTLINHNLAHLKHRAMFCLGAYTSITFCGSCLRTCTLYCRVGHGLVLGFFYLVVLWASAAL